MNSKNSNRFYVYEHIRNDTGVVFYVGKGTGKRAKLQHGRSEYWLRIVSKSNGFTVRMIAKDIDEQQAHSIEIKRIAELRALGVALCNLTDGGEGCAGLIKSKETITKIAASNTGKTHSPETRAKISAARKMVKCKPLTDEHKAKISASLTGRTTISLEGRARLSEAQKKRKRKPLSEATRAKISASKRAKSHKVIDLISD